MEQDPGRNMLADTIAVHSTFAAETTLRTSVRWHCAEPRRRVGVAAAMTLVAIVECQVTFLVVLQVVATANAAKHLLLRNA